MSQENVELLRRFHTAFNRRDLDALLALHDPEVEVVSLRMELEGGHPFQGHEGVRSWYESLLDVYPDFGSEIEEVRELGEVTIARLRQYGRGRESDAPIKLTVSRRPRAQQKDRLVVRCKEGGRSARSRRA